MRAQLSQFLRQARQAILLLAGHSRMRS